MINQARFVNTLHKEGVEFFVGVPDSYLNGFCNYLLEHVPEENHMIAANEGNAVGIAAGYYFSTNRVPLVYMQNSGMGNAFNPIVSLADKNVYSVPLVLLIGWRGEPGTNDWPQHRTQGAVTDKLLEMLDIPFAAAEDNDDLMEARIQWAVRLARTRKGPVAVIAGKGVFAGGKKTSVLSGRYPMSREEAIEIILDTLPEHTIYVATTGRATRELYFLRERRKEGHGHDFLNVGAMGHASSVALGLAAADRGRQIVCLDGDCSALMHMGAFSMVSKVDVPNLMHVVLNNGAHESVGGQPSAGYSVDFTCIAKGAGYVTADSYVMSGDELAETVNRLAGAEKASFIEVRIHKGLRGDLPPLKISHHGLIQELMEELRR
ncbi:MULTISPECIES: phosphonopyruvate decarboxylase [unclassified Clostridium]|jgi:phosphonopyruvate decarboxylase|uniref:phosphonopyruvate decarboxylase n=1 Tax=unclassified Clostridium TaxID=2614128 RepID=UPI0011060C55|nr:MULTISPECIES: phosphonopyruvate decarboxylase [unclassified Clostridium]